MLAHNYCSVGTAALHLQRWLQILAVPVSFKVFLTLLKVFWNSFSAFHVLFNVLQGVLVILPPALRAFPGWGWAHRTRFRRLGRRRGPRSCLGNEGRPLLRHGERSRSHLMFELGGTENSLILVTMVVNVLAANRPRPLCIVSKSVICTV